MTRFYGAIGYGTSTEEPADSGVWKDVITERPYYGDVIRDTRKLESGQGLNDNITLGNRISVVADDFIIEHFHKIKYVIVAGVYWVVSDVEVQRPRLILSLGSVYNGPKA